MPRVRIIKKNDEYSSEYDLGDKKVNLCKKIEEVTNNAIFK